MAGGADTPGSEKWVKLRLAVRIWGMDSAGHAFQLRTETVEVKRTAARLNAVEGLKVGDVIGLQFEEAKGRFKVTRVASAGSPDAGQVLIESLVPGVCLWADPITYHGIQAQPTGWTQPAVSPANTPILERRTGRGGEVPNERRNRSRRQAERFACAGTVEVNSEKNKFPMWATLSDVSSGGCYIETRTPMPLGTQLDMVLKISGSHFRARGVVRTMHPMVGMGAGFLSMPTPGDQQELGRLLAQLGAANAPAPLPVSAPAPEPAGMSDRDTMAMLRVPLLLSQIGEMEDLLKVSTVHGRILNDFHEALFHTSRTLGNIQRFFELSAKKQDPYSVLASVHEERVRVATELLSHLAMDMDSLEIHAQTQGLTSLRDAVQGLLQRFSGFAADRPDIFKR